MNKRSKQFDISRTASARGSFNQVALMGCTLTPPGEYDGSVCTTAWRCGYRYHYCSTTCPPLIIALHVTGSTCCG